VDADAERLLQRARQLGIGLLIAAMVVDAAWGPYGRARARLLMWQRRVLRYAEPPGALIASFGASLLDAAGSSPKR